MANSITENTKNALDSWAKTIQQGNAWIATNTQQDILKFLNDTKNLCTPGFILRRQIQTNFYGFMESAAEKLNVDVNGFADLEKSGNVAWSDAFIAELAKILSAQNFSGYGDKNLSIKKDQWQKYLRDEAFCNRETAIKLIFALNMDEVTAAKFLLSNNYTLLSVRNPFDFVCMFCLKCGYSYPFALEIFNEFEKNLGNARNNSPQNPTPKMTDSMRTAIQEIHDDIEDVDDRKKALLDYMKKNIGEFTLRVQKKNLPNETRYADGFSLQNIDRLKLFMKYLAILYPVKTNEDGEPKVYSQLVKAMLESQGIKLIGFADALNLPAREVEKRAYDKLPFNNGVVLPLKNLAQNLRSNTRAIDYPANAQGISRNTIMLLAYFFITGYLFKENDLIAQLTAELENCNDSNKKLISGLLESAAILDDIPNADNTLQSYIEVINFILSGFEFSECYLPFAIDKFIIICLVADPLNAPMIKRDNNATALQYLINLIISENYQQIEEQRQLEITDTREILPEGVILVDENGVKYKIEGKIDSGGTSIIYNATLENSQRVFVIKECYPLHKRFTFIRKNGVVCSIDGNVAAEKYLKQLRSNMARESELGQVFARQSARIISALNDLTIRKIIFENKTYNVKDSHFILMEQAEGEFDRAKGWSLNNLLKECSLPPDKDFPLRNGGLPSPYVATCIIEELLRSLSYIHGAGYIHGDIQDGNFFLMAQDERTGYIGVGQLMDFGTAYPIIKDDTTEIIKDVFSTLGYRSPEISNSDGNVRLTKATDIYSVGCMMLYLLKGMTFKEVWGEKISSGAFIGSFANLAGIIKCGYQRTAANLFRNILLKALKINPAQRYRNANEMLIDILHLKKFVQPPRFLLSQNLSRSPYFVKHSRDAEIAELQKAMVNTKPLWIWGIGGIGKTELAMEFARKQLDNGINAYFVTYRGTMKATVLAMEFSGYQFDGNGNAEEAEYRERLNLLKEDYGGSLLIIDNFESENLDLAALQAEPAYQDIVGLDMYILFTTRSRPNNSALELGTLTEKDAMTLFKSIAKIKRGDTPIVQKLLREVQFHPMAVELIAHTLNESWGIISAKELLAQLKKNLNATNLPEVSIQKNQLVNEAKIYEHIKTLFNIFNLDGKYREVLCHTTLLPIDGMDAAEFILSENDAKKNLLKKLEGHGWIRRRQGNNRLYIHPLVRSVFKNELKPANDDCQEFLENLWRRLDDKYPQDIELFKQAAELYERAINDLGDIDGTNNFHAGFCSIVAGNSMRAAFFEDKAVKLAEAAQDKNFEMARLYNDAGVAHLMIGDVENGMNYLEKAIVILTKSAQKDPNAANVFANASNIYIDLGDYDKAINLAERAVKIFKKKPPKNKFEQVNTYQTLGRAFTFAKNYDEAMANMKIVIKLMENLTPEGSADLAKSYRNIGEIYALTDDFQNAADYVLKAIRMQEKFLPKNHSETILSYDLIGEIYQYAGNDAESKKFFDKAARAIKINQERNWKKILANTLEIIEMGNLSASEFVHHYRNTADNYLNLGDLDNALKYITAAENKLPEITDPIEIALTYLSLSKIYEAQGNFDAAIEYAKKNLDTIAQDNFNDLSYVCRRLGDLYWRVKKFAESIDFYKKSVQFQLKYAYPEFDFIDDVKVSIAMTLSDMGRIDESEKVFQEILARKSQFYPDSHNIIKQLKKLLADVRAKKNS